MTVIECSLIVSIMLSEGAQAQALGLDLELGLSMRSTVILALTLLVTTLTLGGGRVTIVQGVIHLVIFATFLFTTIVP
ncbi:hypothetical protein [Qipengyuania spongiae]|uniref:Uncharacterized protein n=1 Tax=Qipengyuania spongiae TaxID=2909673 RepID=A0ABY5SZF7_9SPHN|nr:hypothetical protein [Qipengyuania spongiae]UVI39912.1 hypothetical protein L1F33_02825 [Qipengyuania spongiae]